MGDENPIRTLRDYSKPSHEGYRNTIGLLVGNNVVPLRSDTIRLVQNECSFQEHRSEDPNQHFKDFLKLVDSLDLDGENREKTRLRLFQFSLRDQACNWLEQCHDEFAHARSSHGYKRSRMHTIPRRRGLTARLAVERLSKSREEFAYARYGHGYKQSWLDAGQGLTTRLDVEKVSNKSHEKIAYARLDHGYKRSRVYTKPRQLFYKADAM
nr:MAK10-like protein [Tanacetum cinerariifolium]